MCQNKPMNLLCAQENRSIGYFYKKLQASVSAFAAKSIQVFNFAKRNRGLHNFVKHNNKSVVCTRKQIYWVFLQILWASVHAFAAKSVQFFSLLKKNLLNLFCVQESNTSIMERLRLVGSLKLQVSFTKEPSKKDDILKKRPITLRSLLIVATPYTFFPLLCCR